MKEEFTYKSTPDGKAPSGYQKKGTFKDVSLRGADPKIIDEYDTECIERGLTRRELANELMGHAKFGGDDVRFYEAFSKTNSYKRVIEILEDEYELNDDHKKNLFCNLEDGP